MTRFITALIAFLAILFLVVLQVSEKGTIPLRTVSRYVCRVRESHRGGVLNHGMTVPKDPTVAG